VQQHITGTSASPPNSQGNGEKRPNMNECPLLPGAWSFVNT